MSTCDGPVHRPSHENVTSDRSLEPVQAPAQSRPFAVPVAGLLYAPLVVGAAHDPAEQEADRTAASIIQRLRLPSLTGTGTPRPLSGGREPEATAPLDILRRKQPAVVNRQSATTAPLDALRRKQPAIAN